jgi:hypothetical protein
MSQLFEHSLLFLGCGYYLLIAYGVVKLPQKGQQRFDGYSSRKKAFMLMGTYVVMAWLVYLIVLDLL